eukprot:gene9137-27543_t
MRFASPVVRCWAESPADVVAVGAPVVLIVKSCAAAVPAAERATECFRK